MRRPRISPIRLLGLAAAFLNPLVSPSQAQSRATASIADPAAFPLTPLSGKVEPAGPLSLASAIDLALSANPTLAAAARELQAMEGTVIQAGVRPNPELTPR